MPRRALLTACVILTTAVPAARGQSPVELVPAPADRQPDPNFLYPQLRPVEATTPLPETGAAACPTCDLRGHDFWTRPTMTGDWWGHRTRL